MKVGAFNPCPKCAATPVSKDDYATSLAMTEHYFPVSELEKLGLQVANGETLHIDPEVRERFIQLLKAEGVGRDDERFGPVEPTDALDVLSDDDHASRRSWWRFWRE